MLRTEKGGSSHSKKGGIQLYSVLIQVQITLDSLQINIFYENTGSLIVHRVGYKL